MHLSNFNIIVRNSISAVSAVLLPIAIYLEKASAISGDNISWLIFCLALVNRRPKTAVFSQYLTLIFLWKKEKVGRRLVTLPTRLPTYTCSGPNKLSLSLTLPLPLSPICTSPSPSAHASNSLTSVPPTTTKINKCVLHFFHNSSQWQGSKKTNIYISPVNHFPTDCFEI